MNDYNDDAVMQTAGIYTDGTAACLRNVRPWALIGRPDDQSAAAVN